MVWLAALLVALAAVPSCDRAERVRALGDGVATTTTVAHIAHDEVVNFGILGFGARGDEPISFTSVTLLGVPDEVEVIDVWATRPSEAPGGGVGALIGPIHLSYERHPVTAITLHPPAPEDWQIIVTVTASEPGRHTIRGVRVDYETPSGTGSFDLPYRMRLEVD